jgi:hypothetical protein
MPKQLPVEQPEPDQKSTAVSGHDTAAFREALRRVLDSDTFSGSHRLSEFLAYVAEAALQGRAELDQYEIAEDFLHKAGTFNPLDDATVRKLASQVRSKLEDFYGGEGSADPIVITLPRRTYVPRFRFRETRSVTPESPHSEAVAEEKRGAQEEQKEKSEQAPPRRHRTPWIFAGAISVAALSVLIWTAAQNRVRSASLESFHAAPIVIPTARGDMRGPILDVAPGAVRLGPPVGDGAEVFARMVFVPEYAVQQAGIMVFQSPDQYVRFGNHFKIRSMTEFALEARARYQGPEGVYQYDPLGQLGMPRWLAIRRTGSTYTAFRSEDGFSWNQFGKPLRMPDPMSAARLGIYAFNGRTDIPSARAVFDDIGAGISFHDRADGPFDEGVFSEWHAATACSDPVSAQIRDSKLEVDFADSALGCNWDLTRNPPAGDSWAVTALLDFAASSGSGAGIVLKGDKGHLSLERRDLNGGSIRLQRSDDQDVSVPDFPGSPPIFLRLAFADRRYSASFSRDGVNFTKIPASVDAASIGKPISVGIGASTAHWTTPGNKSAVRFYRVYQEVPNPVPLDQASGRPQS